MKFLAKLKSALNKIKWQTVAEKAAAKAAEALVKWLAMRNKRRGPPPPPTATAPVT